MRYPTSGMLCRPTLMSEAMLSSRMEPGKSQKLPPPCRNLVVHAAYGPKRRDFLPSMMRVSRCGTAIVGAAPGDMPYTLATCCSTTSGLSHRSHWPPIGNPPKPLLSAMPLFCSSGKLPPPAPMKTNFAELVNVRPFCRFFTFTSQPFSVRVRSVTRCSVA